MRRAITLLMAVMLITTLVVWYARTSEAKPEARTVPGDNLVKVFSGQGILAQEPYQAFSGQTLLFTIMNNRTNQETALAIMEDGIARMLVRKGKGREVRTALDESGVPLAVGIEKDGVKDGLFITYGESYCEGLVEQFENGSAVKELEFRSFEELKAFISRAGGPLTAAVAREAQADGKEQSDGAEPEPEE